MKKTFFLYDFVIEKKNGYIPHPVLLKVGFKIATKYKKKYGILADKVEVTLPNGNIIKVNQYPIEFKPIALLLLKQELFLNKRKRKPSKSVNKAKQEYWRLNTEFRKRCN